jgi:hypothetical protein
MSKMFDAARGHFGTPESTVVCYAQIDSSEASRAAAVEYLGGYVGTYLLTMQQQSPGANFDVDPTNPASKLPWGAHAVWESRFDLDTGVFGCTSWTEDLDITRRFRANQTIDCWVAILAAHLNSPRLFEAADFYALNDQFAALTGQEIPGLPKRPGQLIILNPGNTSVFQMPPDWRTAVGPTAGRAQVDLGNKLITLSDGS